MVGSLNDALDVMVGVISAGVIVGAIVMCAVIAMRKVKAD